MIQGIVFDWDGVLYDSFSYYYKFLRILSKKEGKKFPFKSFNDFREQMPQNFHEAVRAIGIGSSDPYKDYKDLYVKHMDAHNIRLFKKMKRLISMLKCAVEMRIKPKNLIYVGDFYTDVMAARNAGIKSVAVTWGYSLKETLEKENPDFIAEQPKDILKIVNRLNRSY